jgi:RNA polymerase sigma factor (sigma-70 family)
MDLKRMRPRDPFADPEKLIRRVYAYVAYRIGDGPDAEDVTTEAIERALRYRESYDAAKGDPVAWVIGIARRVLYSPPVSARTALLDELAQTTDDLEEKTLRRLSLAAAVSRLGDRDRELVALRYGADLSAGEIGQLLEMKTNAVEVALHRAVARLRAELSDEPTVRSRPVVQPVPD